MSKSAIVTLQGPLSYAVKGHEFRRNVPKVCPPQLVEHLAGTGKFKIVETSVAKKPVGESKAPAKKASGKPKVMPQARTLAAENGIDIEDVPGSGKNGTVTVSDVKTYMKKAAAPSGQLDPAEGDVVVVES